MPKNKSAKEIAADKERRKKLETQKNENTSKLMAKNQAERDEKQAEMATRAAALAEAARLKSNAINQYVATNNAAVRAIVDEVLTLRKNNPTVNGINAGNNAVGNTEGGNTNPISIVIPVNAHGIVQSDVTRKMTGFDSSDSGVFKFRVSNVLVHAS